MFNIDTGLILNINYIKSINNFTILIFSNYETVNHQDDYISKTDVNTI